MFSQSEVKELCISRALICRDEALDFSIDGLGEGICIALDEII